MAIFKRMMDIINKPSSPPDKGYVRVSGSKILSPAGDPVFLKVADWEAPGEREHGRIKVPEKTIKRFMDYMATVGLNCILLKANGYVIHDDRSKNQHELNVLHRLIKHAESKGIYVIINLFCPWGRAKGSGSFADRPDKLVINPWDWNHRGYASEYVINVCREFKDYPMVMWELVNEGERYNPAVFKKMAREHLLKHMKNILEADRPMGVSQEPLWDLPVNVLFSHRAHHMPTATNRAIVANELAYDRDLWKDSSIRNPARYPEYVGAFNEAKSKGHSGVSAATILNLNTFFSNPSPAARRVLEALGKM